MRISTFLFQLTAIMLFMSNVAQSQNLELSDSGMRLDGIAALVNDGVVLDSELQDQTMLIVQRLRAEGTPLPPQDVLVQQVLENLVVSQIQLQRAEREGIVVPDEILNRALSDIARRNGTTLTELPALLAADGMDYGAYRKEMREQLIMERLRMRDVISRIAITNRELEDYLAREENTSFRNNQYNISHILIALPATTSPDALETARKKAWDIYEQLQNGADFAQLAVTYSNAQTALDGGAMGWRSGEALPSLFADVVPAMEAGAVSEPIRSSSGFNLVKLNDVKGNEPIMEDQVHARHILMTTDEIMDDDIVEQKLIEIRAGILNGDDFAAVAKAVSDDPGSAVEGGDLGWAGPGMFVGVFEETLNSLEIGEISEPFQSQFGWHIVEVLERRVHDTTDDVLRQRAMMAIRDSKVAEETELWLRQLRDESFVEYRL
ncbi:MAG: peptidylprolyl isomerase [Gammaproteobacteria bacterium]|jgi:peptidyl-prolyl cis-trans isomerase SurA